MTTSESFRALRRANPRVKAGFTRSVEAAADAVRHRIAASHAEAPRYSLRRRRLVGVSAAGAAVAAAAAVAAIVTIGSPGPGPGVESAIAAVKEAATVSAASAERSGTAVVRITHNGKLWAGTTVRWTGADLAVSRDAPLRRRKAGDELRVVDGVMYGIDPKRSWVVLGSPESVDPDSGTTPAEYLAAVRLDVGGVTLRRIVGGMTGLTTRRLADGSTVYSGKVAAGLIASETGFKEGSAIRVLPFGYVAHDEAADPGALLDGSVTVDSGGIVREIAVSWGTAASAWRFEVSYANLGSTAAPTAPKNARPFPDRSPAD